MLGRALGVVAGFMHSLAGGRGEHAYSCIALSSAHLFLVCRYIPVLHSTNLNCKDILGAGGFISGRWMKQGKCHTDRRRFNTILLQNYSLAVSFMVSSFYCLFVSSVLLWAVRTAIVPLS